MKNADKNPLMVEPLFLESYLAAVKNSVGSSTFRSIFARVGSIKQDIMRDGELSCAFFVSSILYMFGLILEIHATVNSTVKDMQSVGWERIEEPTPGAIVVYGTIDYEDGESHNHIGFYIGDNKAVSNSYSKRTPIEHEYNYRPIESMWWHPNLSKEVWDMSLRVSKKNP